MIEMRIKIAKKPEKSVKLNRLKIVILIFSINEVLLKNLFHLKHFLLRIIDHLHSKISSTIYILTTFLY